jgi:hypothetical protein
MIPDVICKEEQSIVSNFRALQKTLKNFLTPSETLRKANTNILLRKKNVAREYGGAIYFICNRT